MIKGIDFFQNSWCCIRGKPQSFLRILDELLASRRVARFEQFLFPLGMLFAPFSKPLIYIKLWLQATFGLSISRNNILQKLPKDCTKWYAMAAELNGPSDPMGYDDGVTVIVTEKIACLTSE